MKFAGHCLLAATLLAAAAARAEDASDAAAVADKPYASIVARNMFALLPMPTNNPEADKPPPDPPPKITPNGIMHIFGRLQALFKVAAKPKAGQPPKDDSYVLSEGERQDDIEVVKINEADAKITFNNHGALQELALVPAKDSGPAAGPGGGPGGTVPGLGNRGLGGARPGTPAGSPAGNPSFNRPRPGVPGMNPGFNGGATAQPNTLQPNLGAGGNFAQPQASQPMSIEDKVMNAAQEMAQIELNRIDTQDAVDSGVLPPLPPTMLTPPDATAHDGFPLIAPAPSMPLPPPPKK